MNATNFRRMALGLEGAEEGAHMGHPDFRVNGRIFATLRTDLHTGVVKLSPGQQQEWLRSAPRAFFPQNGAWGLQGWTTVHLGEIDEETLGEALTMAWQGAMAKKAPARAKVAPPAKRQPAPRATTSGTRSAKTPTTVDEVHRRMCTGCSADPGEGEGDRQNGSTGIRREDQLPHTRVHDERRAPLFCRLQESHRHLSACEG